MSPATTAGDLVLERALRRAAGSSAAVADELVELAHGRRAPLAEAHAMLLARLYGRPDDFAATGALQIVIRALQQIADTRPGLGQSPDHGRRSRKAAGTGR